MANAVVAIAGSSGLIGSALTAALRAAERLAAPSTALPR